MTTNRHYVSVNCGSRPTSEVVSLVNGLDLWVYDGMLESLTETESHCVKVYGDFESATDFEAALQALGKVVGDGSVEEIVVDSDAATDVPLQWGAATVVWSENGYVLTVPMYLDKRAVASLDRAKLARDLGNAQLQLQPAVWTRGPNGTSVQRGSLVLISPKLLDLSPVELRITHNNAANAARRQAAEDDTTDDTRIAAYIEALRKT